MEKYNLNHEIIFLSNFEYGKTQNIEIKVGRKTLMLDVDKNKNSAFLDVYEKNPMTVKVIQSTAPISILLWLNLMQL